jgi:hypothetical protein
MKLWAPSVLTPQSPWSELDMCRGERGPKCLYHMRSLYSTFLCMKPFTLLHGLIQLVTSRLGYHIPVSLQYSSDYISQVARSWMTDGSMIKLSLCLKNVIRSIANSTTLRQSHLPFSYVPTVFARSNTAIVGSNPTEARMFVCVFSVST